MHHNPSLPTQSPSDISIYTFVNERGENETFNELGYLGFPLLNKSRIRIADLLEQREKME